MTRRGTIGGAVAVLAAVAVLVLAGAGTARAAGGGVGGPTLPYSPSSSSTTTTSTSTTTTTTVPSARSKAASPTSRTTTTTIPPTPAQAAEAASVPRGGEESTEPLLEVLAPLAKLGFSEEQMAVAGFGQFPVAGPASWSDDFLEYRSWPEPHVHQGIDIAAPEGTPLRSPADGTLSYSDSDPKGYGLTAIVTQSDGTTFLLAHMSATVAGLSTGSAVIQGQVIGFVGETGDATGPHLDFEIHPHGGPAIDATPYLDEYLAAAIANAPRVIAEYEGKPVAAAGAAPAVTVPAASPPVGTALGRGRPRAAGRGGELALVSTRRSSSATAAHIGGVLALLVPIAMLAEMSRRRRWWPLRD